MGWTRQDVLDVARSTGETVVEAWSEHNAGVMGTVVGPMLHHTGSAWSWPRLTAPTLKTVREGRSDLQNSLCMYYIDYAGVIYCISEKLSWHAGAGSWAGVTDGNGHYAGIEAESDGARWTDATLRAYKKLAAAILRKAGRDIAYAPRHADYALPKGRKTDFSGYDAKTFLKDVAGLLAGTPAPTKPAQEADVLHQVNLTNPDGDTPDQAVVLTVDGVGTSKVLPDGAQAWLQWAAFFPPTSGVPADPKARLDWLVYRGVGVDLPQPPRDLKNRDRSPSSPLPKGTSEVEVRVLGIPKGGCVSFQLSATGRAA